MKTLKGWDEYAQTHENGDWHHYCQPGDEIDADAYDYFLDILPPLIIRRGYFQVGEPVDSRPDPDGNFRETWPTFARDGSRYYFLGACFAGGREHIA